MILKLLGDDRLVLAIGNLGRRGAIADTLWAHGHPSATDLTDIVRVANHIPHGVLAKKVVSVIVQRLVVSAIVIDYLTTCRQVAEKLGIEHQVSYFHVQRWVGYVMRELDESLPKDWLVSIGNIIGSSTGTGMDLGPIIALSKLLEK